MTNTSINESGILIFNDEVTEQLVGKSEFSDFNDFFGSASPTTPGPTNISSDLLPSFNVNNIEKIADAQAASKLDGLEELLNVDSDLYFPLIDILIANPTPATWVRCDLTTHQITHHQSILPDERAIIFDVETFVTAGGYPIIGQALSSSALWLYLDASFDGITNYKPSLLKLGDSKRLIIAQNAAFDACRIEERFSMAAAQQLNFIDTMSLTNCLAGLSSDSRWALAVAPGTNGRADSIRKLGCGKSLVDAYNWFCPQYAPLTKSDKNTRNIFVEATSFSEFILNQEELLRYSLLDCIYTLRLLQAQMKRFKVWAGPATSAILLGHSTVLNALVPIQEDRPRWITLCDDMSGMSFAEINVQVHDYFTEIHSAWLLGTLDESSIKVDWKLAKPKGWRKRTLPEGWPTMAKWYAAFLNNDLGVTTNDFGRLLQLEYYYGASYRPLYQSQKYGWHFYDRTGEVHRVPHISGVHGLNVGSMISADSLRFFDDYETPILRSKTLNYDDKLLLHILELADNSSIWKGFSGRIKSQVTNMPVS